MREPAALTTICPSPGSSRPQSRRGTASGPSPDKISVHEVGNRPPSGHLRRVGRSRGERFAMAKPAEQMVTDDVAPLPTLSRVARKRNQRIRQILEAAADVMGQHGAARFNLEDVAERMDLTKATLYHYFSSREVLLVAAIETLAERIIAELRSVVETDTHGATSCLQALLRKQLSVVVSDYP